jgi:hypothetical protein
MKNARKKSVAVLAGLAITGLIGAAAATLGGIRSDNLGADAAAVESCNTGGVDVAYTYGYDADSAEYVVTEVTVSDIDTACVGQTIEVTLADVDGEELGDASDTVSGTSVTLTVDDISAAELEKIAIVISN